MVFASTSPAQRRDWPWIRRRLAEIVGENGVVRRKEEILTYECDGLSAYRKRPALVVLPKTTAEIAAIAKFCHTQEIPWVARGAGTGLSGGALPLEEGILIVTARMREILNIDLDNQQITVQPGVINNWVTQAVSGAGFYYAPDPSSQTVCSIGGNVAENSGGVHCFKYGVTTNHVLKLKVVTPTGEIVTLGGAVPEMPGYDLMGVFVGSEGTLGIATEITLKVLKQPEAVCVLLADYTSIEAAGNSVAAIVSAGIIPAGMEIMDNFSINAVEDIVQLNCYPRDAAAILLIEIDGMAAEIQAAKERIKDICLAQGARQITSASDPETRLKLWKGRKSAFAAAGNISPDYFVQDGVIPRTKLAEVLTEINAIGDRHGYKIANVFHAGDGNLHPLILYNSAIPGDLEAVEQVGGEILKLCVAKGGSISGEHGIGADKKMYMADMFNDADLETMGYVRNAFNPKGLANPGKLFPTPRTCGESAKMTNVADCKNADLF
ncbi:glycolate oxidase subunit GlcD [Synechococcus moorigangaii CMS01]|nr:glycolate oxidase subunit GlcD [Synechococcus moorigangaii CMS01]